MLPKMMAERSKRLRERKKMANDERFRQKNIDRYRRLRAAQSDADS